MVDLMKVGQRKKTIEELAREYFLGSSEEDDLYGSCEDCDMFGNPFIFEREKKPTKTDIKPRQPIDEEINWFDINVDDLPF